MAFVDTADSDHRLEDLDVADVARVPGEQRFQCERPVGGDHEVHPVARDVDARKAFASSTISSACTITTPSWKAAASAMVGVSSVFGPVYRLPSRSALRRRTAARRRVPGRRTSGRTARRRCGWRRSRTVPSSTSLGDPHTLRSGIGQIEFGGDAALEQVEVFGARHRRDQHVQVVEPLRVAVGQRARQEVGLLLVVALQGDPVARADHACSRSFRLPGLITLPSQWAAPAVIRGPWRGGGRPSRGHCTESIAFWITAVTASGWEISVRCEPPSNR